MSELTIEQIKHLYFDSDALVEPNYRLMRVDGNGFRWYVEVTDSGDYVFYNNVTSFLSYTMPDPYWLIEYRKRMGWERAEQHMKQRANYGNIMHDTCLDKILISGRVGDIETLVDQQIEEHGEPQNKEFFNDWRYELKKDILAWTTFLIDRKVKPLAIESMMRSESMGLAGSQDLLCDLQFNRGMVRSIVDLKSGKHGFSEHNEVQLHVYRRIAEENSISEKPISHVFNFAPNDWRSKPSYKFRNQSDSDWKDSIDPLLKVFRIALAARGKDKPKDVTRIHGSIDIDSGNAGSYDILSFDDYLKLQEA